MNSIIKTIGFAGTSLFLASAFANTGAMKSEGEMKDPQVSESSRTPDSSMKWNKRSHNMKTQVKDAQSALSSRGYDISVDGVMGSETKNALQEFQKEQGIQETGRLDSATLRALNLQETERTPASINEESDLNKDLNKTDTEDSNYDEMSQ